MASQTDQRTADLKELNEILEHQPRIKLLQTEGDPPDCYEIEYHLAGLSKAEDGSVSKASRHVMLITLPFGYPHFPPAVKPLTPVFHPDIDPDAVRISSRWQQEPSLAKLVLHLGEMICGKVYSLEDPFNQEAADWYGDHAAELPLDSLESGAEAETGAADEFDLGLEDIDLSSIAPSAEEEAGGGVELSLELTPPQAVHDVSGISHAAAEEQGGSGLALELEPSPASDAQENFDLGLDDAVPVSAQDESEFELEIGEPESAPPQEDFSAKLEEIRVHIDRKEVYIAERLLKEIPPALLEADGLRQKVRKAQEQCDALLQEMKVLEDEDNFPEAQKIFAKLKKIAPDFPGLADIGRRLDQSQSMLDTFSIKEKAADGSAEGPQTEQPPGGEKKKKKSSPPPPPKEKPVEKVEKNREKSRISRTIHREIPVAPFAAAGIVAALIVAGGLIYTRDSNILMEAGLDWQDAQSQFKRKNYQGAEDKAGAALGRLKSILIPLPEKSRIRKEIEELLSSDDFTKGKEGKRSYRGQDLPIEEADKHEQTDRLAAQADALKAGRAREAAELYEQAAALAAAAPVYPVAAELERFQEEARQLRLKAAVSAAEEAEDLGDWKKAAESWQQAVKHCKAGDSCEKFSKKMSQAVFKRELDVSRENFKNSHSQWQETVDKLKKLRERMDSDPNAFTDENRRELERLLARSQFYQLLSTASEFYSKGDDAAAVRDYREAASLLRSKQAMFEPEERGGVDKITRTALMIEVSSKLNAAGEAERQSRQSEALRLYDEAQKLLGSSGIDPALEKSVKEKTDGLRKNFDEQRRMDWLNRNYKKLFCEAYPSSCGSDLSRPGMTLGKRINSMELYKLHCVERSQGSSYRLELDYLYNPAANQWMPYRDGQ